MLPTILDPPPLTFWLYLWIKFSVYTTTNCNFPKGSLEIYRFHKFVPNLWKTSLHGFISFKHKHHALFKNGSCVHDFCVWTTQINIQHLCLNNMNKQMTFMFKKCIWHQCSNNTNRWMTYVSIPYEPILWKINFLGLLLPNCDPWNLWCSI
jgi:hypothetical protein